MNKCPYTAAKSTLKSWLEPLTARIAKLPIDRGFPVPWFVDRIKGKPEFRAMAVHKHAKALRKKLCWVCGEPLDFNGTFVIGPMCAINRVSSEPPSHLECARWSARNCPFLTMREPERRDDATTEGMRSIGGIAIRRNPGVALLWTTPNWNTFSDGNGGILIKIGEPVATEWWARGRAATREEVLESVRTGLPSLEELAMAQGREAMAALAQTKQAAEVFYPS